MRTEHSLYSQGVSRLWRQTGRLAVALMAALLVVLALAASLAFASDLAGPSHIAGPAEQKAPESTATSPAFVNSGVITVSYVATDTGTPDASGLDWVRLDYQVDGGDWHVNVMSHTFPSSPTNAADEFAFSPPDGDGEYHFRTIAQDIDGNPEVKETSDTSTVYDTAPPVLSSEGVDEHSPYIHYDGATVWYGDDMLSGQTFAVQGAAEDPLAGVFQASFTAALGSGPFVDDTPEAWRSGDYTVDLSDTDSGVITVTVVDSATNAAYAYFPYERDTDPPASLVTATVQHTNTAPIPIDWSSSDAKAGSAETCLWYKAGGGWQDDSNCETGTDGQFAFTPGTDDKFLFDAVAIDNVGNASPEPTGEDQSWTIYDTEEPASTAESPPVTNLSPFNVNWTAGDPVPAGGGTPAGLDEICLWFRFGIGAWSEDQCTTGAESGQFSFTPGANGTYYFTTIATDKATNSEMVTPPSASDDSTLFDDVRPTAIVTTPAEVYVRSWQVDWSGLDPAPTSGLDDFEIQYRVDNGAWLTWLPGAAEGGDTFGPTSPVPVNVLSDYAFRARSSDLAGNVGFYSPIVTTSVKMSYVYLPLIDRNYRPLQNPDFEDGWTGWAHGGALPHVISDQVVQHGSFAALLGDPSLPCEPDEGTPFPTGATAWAQQTFTVPPDVTTLRVRYKIYSYDQINGSLYDRFEIWVADQRELQDGFGDDYGCHLPVQTTSSWQVFELNVSALAGTNITLRLENWIWPDNWFNTWTYIDHVELLP